MNKQEAKKFILQNWKASSGKRITEMLLRYFDLKENKSAKTENSIALAKEIFNI